MSNPICVESDSVESDMRCALSTISPDIEQLVAKKQGQPSH